MLLDELYPLRVQPLWRELPWLDLRHVVLPPTTIVMNCDHDVFSPCPPEMPAKKDNPEYMDRYGSTYLTLVISRLNMFSNWQIVQ